MTSGNRPAPEQGSWQIPGAASAYQAPSETLRGAGRGRPGLVALVVALSELVIIGAACNQAVTKHTQRYFFDHADTFLGNAVGSSLTFAWRFTPTDGDNRNGIHLLAGQLVSIGVLVVLSALLAAVLAHGVVTFWRVFFGVWTAVLAAGCVGRVVGALVTRSTDDRLDRATNATFRSITGVTVFAALVIGLLTALIAALIAVATRRAVEQPAVAAAAPEPAYVPEAPPPFYGGGAPQQAPQQQPGGQENDGRTMQIPRFDPGGGGQWKPPADGGSTQAMPTTPDDERRG